MIGQTISQYEILEQLGSGGMGVVYKARDTKLDRLVALKFLPPELSRDEEANQRFIQEAKAVTALDHPNICRVHDIRETENGRLFIVMSFYDGQTLKYRLKDGPIPQDRAVDIARQMAEGLSVAHKKGVVHRDIKPANIMVTEDGQVKILDFGLAKLSGALALTKTGSTLGTTYYMSPEQLRGETADEKSDIWALGVVLYQMLTGDRPFTGDYDQAIAYATLNTNPDFSLIDDSTVRSVVESCLRKDPTERFESAQQLAEALRALAVGSNSSTIVLPRRRMRSRALFGLATLFVVVALAVSWFATRPTQQAEATTPPRKMLIVLPFENLGKPEDQYFVDGMAQELSTRLSSIGALGVISRNTANRYRGTDKTTPEIGEELGVDYVVGGTVRWAEEPDGSRRVRITPYLTRVSDDLQLWADSYDRDLSDVLDVERDVAMQIARNLETTIEPAEAEQVSVKLTDNSDAYDEYLKGLELVTKIRVDSTDLAQGIEHFQKALELDTLFVEAAFRLSQSAGRFVWSYSWAPKGRVSEQWTNVAREAAQRAKAIAPNSRADLLADGYYNYYLLKDYGVALSLFVRAQEIAEDVTVLEAISDIQLRLGNFEFALDYFDRALALNPQDVRLLSRAAGVAYYVRQFSRSLEYREREVAIEPSDFAYCDRQAGIVWNQVRLDGNTERARRTIERQDLTCTSGIDFYDRRFKELLDRSEQGEDIWIVYMLEVYRQLGLRDRELKAYEALREDTDDNVNTYGFRAVAEAGLGNRGEALATLDSFRVWIETDRSLVFANYNPFAAFVYTRLGMRNELFKVLESEVKRPGYMNSTWLRMPWFDPVRDDPRFEDVMKKFEAWEKKSR